MIILLAGSSGFLGRHVKVALEQAGHTVERLTRTTLANDLTLSQSDLYINCAGNTETPETMYEANVEIVHQLLKAARFFNKRLIHVGTIAEDLPGNSVYQATKRAATNLCLSYAEEWNVDVCVVKPSTIYGVGDKESAFFPTLCAAHQSKTLFVCRNETRAWIHVRDVAAAIVALATTPDTRGQTYSAFGVEVLNRHLIQIFENLNGPVNWTVDQESHVWQWWAYECDMARLYEAGWKGPQISLVDGIREIIVDMRANEQVWLGAEA